jgi:hypothetical protein
MRVIRYAAIASVFAVGALVPLGAAHAGSATGASSTWAPGYEWSDAGRYEMSPQAGAHRIPDQSVKVLRSETWKPGYNYNPAGYYEKIVRVDAPSDFKPAAGSRSSVEIDARDTWAPGYDWTDTGRYERKIDR